MQLGWAEVVVWSFVARVDVKGAWLGKAAPWPVRGGGFRFLLVGDRLGLAAYAAGVRGARYGISQPPAATGKAGARRSGPRGAPGHLVGVGMHAATGVDGSSKGGRKGGGAGCTAGSCSLGRPGRRPRGVSGASCAVRGAASGARLVTSGGLIMAC
jgi:hypothetical protein